ncbi:MAG: hypothetical protein ACFE7R_06975, partial [Candidatus Hodarchaeota archaeon]
MSRFLKSDPLKKAKKHVEKALKELEADYPDYASTEYEKAARLFLESQEIDFAIKYFREAALCSLSVNDHTRSGDMKIEAARALFFDTRYDEGGGLYIEASDHYFRADKPRASLRSIAIGIIGYLGARNFETAVNLTRKAEKRFQPSDFNKSPFFLLARLSVKVLCEGGRATSKELSKARKAAKPAQEELDLINFVTGSVDLALKTEVVIEWAGAEMKEVSTKTPIEFELRYKCPVPVKVVACRYNLSTGLSFLREPEIKPQSAKQESWLMEVIPALSGAGSVGPFNLTLEGDRVLVNKLSNVIEFSIARAPSDLHLDLTPERISCGLGDETVFDATIRNEGDGPAENIKVEIELSDGLELSLGGADKT